MRANQSAVRSFQRFMLSDREDEIQTDRAAMIRAAASPYAFGAPAVASALEPCSSAVIKFAGGSNSRSAAIDAFARIETEGVANPAGWAAINPSANASTSVMAVATASERRSRHRSLAVTRSIKKVPLAPRTVPPRPATTVAQSDMVPTVQGGASRPAET